MGCADKSALDGAGMPDFLSGSREHVQSLIGELVCGDPARRMLQSGAVQSRLAQLGEQSSITAHELRQPLFTIAVASENLRLMLERPEPDAAMMRQAVERIADQVQRAQAIIDQTLSFASGRELFGAEHSDAGDAVNRAIDFLAEMFMQNDIGVVRHWSEHPIRVNVPAIELEQVFVNVLRNAAESIAERRRCGAWNARGRILIEFDVVDGRLNCRVSDNGAGFAGQALETAFEPFFTTKSREGTGLGLHICRQIVTKGGGTISVHPGAPVGARVEIVLPPAPPSDIVAS